MESRALLILLVMALPLTAAEERRGVVGLFDSKGRRDDLASEDPVHQLLEMPLNHLGMTVRRHDIRRGPPEAELLEGARAVVTFFGATDVAPDWLWPWLERETASRGWRVIHLDEFGPLAEDPARLARWLDRFGLGSDPGYKRGPVGIEVKLRDPRICAYEADPRVRAIHRGPRNRAPGNRVWVTTHPIGSPEDARMPVVTGDWGAVALSPWIAVSGGKFLDRRWHLDPFAFFREALGLEGVPAPHPAMLNGSRIFFIHVDGDGFESLSTVRRGVFCGRVFLDDVLRPHRLPFTVSIIVRGLTEDYDVEEPTDRMRIAREIFALPHVESGSHGVLHPLRWDYEKNWYPSLRNYAYGPLAEVRASVRFISGRLAPRGRPCRMMLWSGESNPPERVLEAAAESGVLNINGGVFRWDRWHDSVGFVSPWGSLVGRTVQVYAGAANENDFAGFFRTMPGAFAHIDQTIERTGAPRVLKPANVYCHFYSAERPARLAALRALVRRWGEEKGTAPVFASTYAKAVRDALLGARIERTERGWVFRAFGGCRTARIDGEPRFVDWDRSRGLLGARRENGSLYLHLAASDAELVFADEPVARPHVERANCLLRDASRAKDVVAFLATAHNPREVVLAGLPPAAAVSVALDGNAHMERTDADGRLTLRLQEPGETRVVVRLVTAADRAE